MARKVLIVGLSLGVALVAGFLALYLFSASFKQAFLDSLGSTYKDEFREKFATECSGGFSGNESACRCVAKGLIENGLYMTPQNLPDFFRTEPGKQLNVKCGLPAMHGADQEKDHGP